MAAITAMPAVCGVTTTGTVYHHSAVCGVTTIGVVLPSFFQERSSRNSVCILLPSFSCRDGEQVTHNKSWNPAASGILEMSRGQ